jgi:hypothetical protein
MEFYGQQKVLDIFRVGFWRENRFGHFLGCFGHFFGGYGHFHPAFGHFFNSFGQILYPFGHLTIFCKKTTPIVAGKQPS